MSNPVVGVPVVGIPVADQDKAVEFYTDAFGFTVRMDMPLPQLGSRWIVLAPAGADAAATGIALVQAGDGLPAGVETGIRLAVADAAAKHAELAGRGVGVGELLRWQGAPPMFTVTDPDGNGLEIVEQ
ncbi:glyoxalase [Actinocatenispora thailandica]|uniref:Glyoxalase n=1 Tax=Actinocatenispora thailandica TaxID=227318 RepID=A0A7R7HYY8_9ACTN|nr:VOC family protein [Actinocatenispora thailandica]BCJ37056.1 glyoxalase [Actinocatenispora thailandica]